MIQEFVDAFMKNKEKCRNLLKEKHPDNYQDIVRIVIETINEKEDTLKEYLKQTERMEIK